MWNCIHFLRQKTLKMVPWRADLRVGSGYYVVCPIITQTRGWTCRLRCQICPLLWLQCGVLCKHVIHRRVYTVKNRLYFVNYHFQRLRTEKAAVDQFIGGMAQCESTENLKRMFLNAPMKLNVTMDNWLECDQCFSTCLHNNYVWRVARIIICTSCDSLR